MNLPPLEAPLLATQSRKKDPQNCIPATCEDFIVNCTKCNCISFPFNPDICSLTPDPDYLPCFYSRDLFTIECTGCLYGAFLDVTGRCIWCGDYINNCNTCRQLKDGTIACDICDYGYAISWFDRAECINCRVQIQNCIACSPSKISMEYICVQCIDNYVLANDGSCTFCEDQFLNCEECVMNKLNPRCKKCKFGYGLIEASVAASKRDTCKMCHEVVPNCIVCVFETENDVTCLACNEGTQMIAKNVCKDCTEIDPYCTMCTNDPRPTCTACKSNMTFTDGKCKSCQSISGGCKECVHGSKPHCTECIPGFYLADRDTGKTCVLCAISVKECAECSSKTGSVICSMCKNGYYLTKNNKCEKVQQNLKGCKEYRLDSCNACVDGYVLVKNACVFCRAHTLGCAKCRIANNDIQCSECINGYYLKDGKCFACSKTISNCRTCIPAKGAITAQEVTCTSCAITYYLDSDHNTCKMVIPNCVYFFKEQSSVQCQMCLADYRLTIDSQGNSACVYIASAKTETWFHIWLMVVLFLTLMFLSFLPAYLKKVLIVKKRAPPSNICGNAPEDKQD